MGNSLNVRSGIPGVDFDQAPAPVNPVAAQPILAASGAPEMATQAPDLAGSPSPDALAQRSATLQAPVAALNPDQQALVASAVLASRQLVADPELESHTENLEQVLRSFSHEPAHVQQAALDAVRKECPGVVAMLEEHNQPGWWQWAGTLALRVVTLGLVGSGSSAPQTQAVEPQAAAPVQASPQDNAVSAAPETPQDVAHDQSLQPQVPPFAQSLDISPSTPERCPNLQPLYRKIEADMQRAGSSCADVHESSWDDEASSQSDDEAIPVPEGDFDAWLANVSTEPLDTADLGHPEAWGVVEQGRLVAEGLSWQGVYPESLVREDAWAGSASLTASAQMLQNMAWLAEGYGHAGRPGGLFDPEPTTAWEGLTGLTRKAVAVADSAEEAPAEIQEPEVASVLPWPQPVAVPEAEEPSQAFTAQENNTLEQAIEGFCQFITLHGTQLLTEKAAQGAIRLMTTAFAQQQKGETPQATAPDVGLQRLSQAQMSLEDFVALVEQHKAFWVAQPQVVEALKALRAKQKARQATKVSS